MIDWFRSVNDEWKDRFYLQTEEYLHGCAFLPRFIFPPLLNLTLLHLFSDQSDQRTRDHPFPFQYPSNRPIDPFDRRFTQSRLAVNSVTMGDYEAPFRISAFVKDLFAGFSLVRPTLQRPTVRYRDY